jgi:hypothetical protein
MSRSLAIRIRTSIFAAELAALSPHDLDVLQARIGPDGTAEDLIETFEVPEESGYGVVTIGIRLKKEATSPAN